MELVIDVKIEVKSNSFRNVITDFGYFKKITGESNQNIGYIRSATKAEFSIKPCYTGIGDGLTITLKHKTLDGVDNAKRLLLSLIDTMKDDFEVFKINRGIPMDVVNVVVELNLAVCGECGFMSTSFPEFEDHVSKDHGSGKEQVKKTPWGTTHSATRSSGQASATRGSADASYNLRSTPKRESTWSKAPNRSPYHVKTAEKPSTFGSTRRQGTSTATTANRSFGLAAKRTALGFAASRYTSTRLPTSFGLAAKRSAVGRPAASTRSATTTRQPKSKYAPPSEKTSRYESIVGSKRGASNMASDVGTAKRAKISRFDNNISTLGDKPAARGISEAERKKQESALPREQNLLSRRLRNDLSDAETKVAIQQLKNKLTAKEVKLVSQQIEETEKREQLPTQRDYVTLQLKVLVGAIRRKSEGFGLGTTGKLQTLSSVKTETGRILQLLMKGQVPDNMVQNVIKKYAEQYKFNRTEKSTIEQKTREEWNKIQKQTGGVPNMYQKNVIHFRNMQKVLFNKVELDGSVVVDFDPFTFINTYKDTSTLPRRTAQKKMVKDRSPPDPERMVTVRMSLEALLRRRDANVIPDHAAEAMCKQLMAAAAPNARAEMVLRQTWESLIERKRFEERREPKKGAKVTIKLTTVVNYIKQQLQDMNVGNDAMEAVMDVLKPQPKPTDPEEPTHNIPIFPVLEKPHATERSINTRLHWMIAEIGFVLNKRKTGQMPDQEVKMMITRIKNGVPPIYYNVVNGRFQETARDIETMAGRPMNVARNLTCQLQVMCTYARHYLLDKLPGGSPLDPAQHRNPFQYIVYDIDEKAQTKRGVQPLMGKKSVQPLMGKQGVKSLMGMGTRSGASQGKIKDIASLMDHMDKAAAEEDKQRILELREYAKEAKIGVASMGVRRVEKIERDLLRKMPNKFKGDLQDHKKQVEGNKGRTLTARERLETTIKWILQNIHASGNGVKSPSANSSKKTSMPAIVRMRGAEVLKRETMKLWNKLKAGKAQLSEITKQLTELRNRLTHPEGDAIKKEYNIEIMKLSKKYKVTRLPDSVAAAIKFEITLKYVMGEDDPIARESIAGDMARGFYDNLKNKQSPVKKFEPKTNNKKSKQNGANAKRAEEDDDDIMIIADPETGKKTNDPRVTVLRNKFNMIARQFRLNQINTDKMAEIIALAKTNLYLSCDDEDELFAEVRCAWEDNGGDDLSEKKKLKIDFDLTAKRISKKVEELIETEDITVVDIRERLGDVMAGKMIEV